MITYLGFPGGNIDQCGRQLGPDSGQQAAVARPAYSEVIASIGRTMSAIIQH